MTTKSREAKSKPTHSNTNQEECNGAASCGVSVTRNGFSDRGFGVRYPERRICIVCNTPGGQLLNCSNKGCLLAFHESFMNDPSFDENGDFYCPYCWYRMKVEQEEKLRERVLLAQKNLLEFLKYNGHDDAHDKREEGGGENGRNGSGVLPLVEKEDPNGDEAEVNVNNVEDQLVRVEKDKMEDGINEKSGDGDQCGLVVGPVRRSDEVDYRHDETILVTNGPKDTDKGRKSEREKLSETPKIEITGEGGAKEGAGRANGREEDIHSEKQHHKEGEDRENDMDQEEAVNSTDQEEKEQHTLECDSGSDVSNTKRETVSVRLTRARRKILEAKEVHNVNLTDQVEKEQHTVECGNGSDISDTKREALSVCLTHARQKVLEAKEVQNVNSTDQEEKEQHTVECDNGSDISDTETETLSVRITHARQKILKAKDAQNVNLTDQEEKEQHTLECDNGSGISDTEREALSVRLTRAKQKILEAKEVQNVNLTDQEEKEQHKLECDNGSDISDTEKETLSVRITRARQKNLKAKEVQNVSSPKKSTPQAKVTSDGKATNGNKKPIASKRLRTAEQECSRNRNNNKDTRKKPRLVQESPKKFSSTTNSDGRRKKLLWTSEEEEMLKEGVEIFSNAINRNMPWRKILEFGRHVFDPSRTPADLKDKWRNMLS